jgi:hypothetical protein
MTLTPPAHPLEVSGATEVILVLRFGQPGLLAATFAGLPTRRLGAEFLVMAITGIGNENLPAAQAFHRGARKSSTRLRAPDQLVPRPFTPTRGRTFTEKKEEKISGKMSKKTANKNTAFSIRRIHPMFRSAPTVASECDDVRPDDSALL